MHMEVDGYNSDRNGDLKAQRYDRVVLRYRFRCEGECVKGDGEKNTAGKGSAGDVTA